MLRALDGPRDLKNCKHTNLIMLTADLFFFVLVLFAFMFPSLTMMSLLHTKQFLCLH